ncbi:AMP-dependent synthetase and ligase [Zychaea mexicana]|uniref:AMP-dependent synthetase and ligase n=1 Tax=Zychaea mexicana TaxID=64656 RepID=UPI0022FE2E7B|nr:AMP-dependent synthetase and ligase [Zychaea mexicana]KAI9490930.1 AMP-dependent synthetase and ligase [Zychaea mexicana]
MHMCLIRLDQVNRKPEQMPYYTPLDPVRFLLRSAMIYRDKTAVIHGDRSFSYETLADRVLRLANLLIHAFHVRPGDRVAVLCQNVPAFLEATFAIPAAGGVLVPINTRLAPPEIEYVVQDSGASILLVQDEILPRVSTTVRASTKLIHIADYQNRGDPLCPYERLLQETETKLMWKDLPLTTDENAIMTINYTSGSTGKPKGAMISYRSIYMLAMTMCIQAQITHSSKYLWTLPLFHCNGWDFPFALMAVGATQYMLNKIDYGYVWKLIKEQGITHYCAAPTVQNELCHHKDAVRLNHVVHSFSGGSTLPNKLVRRLNSLNVHVTQVYGLTEVTGPAILSYDDGALSQHPKEKHLDLFSRQGYNILSLDQVRVLDQKTAKDIKPDGMQIGELCLVGNTTMRGYFNNPEATKKAFREGYFWTGDLAVIYPDGAIEIVDRAKDVIISGGENISSIELENVIGSLEKVLECAVVAGPDDKWGERPVAYVVVKEGHTITVEEIIAHCRERLAGYKCPSKVMLVKSIPKSGTGKLQKNLLRDELWKSHKRRIN